MEEDIQRKDGVDYINLSIINIMSNEVKEELDKYGVLWYKKKLNPDQVKYHQKHMNKATFIKYSPEMKIEGEYLYTKGFGQDLENYDTDSKIYKDGIVYALKAIKELNDKGIYHGDILSGHEGTDIQDKNIVYDGSEYRLIDFGPRTEKKTLEPMKVNQNMNPNRPKPTGMKADAEDPLEQEKNLLINYNKTAKLRKHEEEQKIRRQENMRKAREARRQSMRKGSNKKVRRQQSFVMDIDDIDDSDDEMPFNVGNIPFSLGTNRKGGKKRRRRTKKKRKRKRKRRTKKKKKKRKSTKKKRRRRRR